MQKAGTLVGTPRPGSEMTATKAHIGAQWLARRRPTGAARASHGASLSPNQLHLLLQKRPVRQRTGVRAEHTAGAQETTPTKWGEGCFLSSFHFQTSKKRPSSPRRPACEPARHACAARLCHARAHTAPPSPPREPWGPGAAARAARAAVPCVMEPRRWCCSLRWWGPCPSGGMARPMRPGGRWQERHYVGPRASPGQRQGPGSSQPAWQWAPP